METLTKCEVNGSVQHKDSLICLKEPKPLGADDALEHVPSEVFKLLVYYWQLDEVRAGPCYGVWGDEMAIISLLLVMHELQ